MIVCSLSECMLRDLKTHSVRVTVSFMCLIMDQRLGFYWWTHTQKHFEYLAYINDCFLFDEGDYFHLLILLLYIIIYSYCILYMAGLPKVWHTGNCEHDYNLLFILFCSCVKILLQWFFLLLKIIQRVNVRSYFRSACLICAVSKAKLYLNQSCRLSYCRAYLHTYHTKHSTYTSAIPANLFQVAGKKRNVPFFCDFSQFTCHTFT